MNGIERIAAERKRQIEEEGWDEEHDLEHGNMVLAVAGASYALDAAALHTDYVDRWREQYQDCSDIIWPFDEKWFKPTPKDPVRQLTKAGALIAAEIDQLLAQQKAQENEPVPGDTLKAMCKY